MPGHIKLGGGGEPDPDPLPYLVVSQEMRRKDMTKAYDAKLSVWAEDGNGGFVEGLKQTEEGDKIKVLLGHENKYFKVAQVAPVNPPKFEKCEDMANLTFLNEASVFWNLKTRYQAKLIYTYSGLFCVVVNPYKRFPIYTQRVVKMYQGKRRNECPPHLWAVTETAYRNMLESGRNQSMLITGESGAGKTENTKKVISYLAMVATTGKKQEKKISLEDQIVATNPILESYGNAKTSRNDNSSRFGKFIRIHFNLTGKLAGCDIKAYLFEKSRITQQQEVERSYHIFYQLLQPAVPDLKEKCLLTDNIYDYTYVSQGRTKVDSIDDNEELQFTDAAFDIIGFSVDEKWNCYRLTAAVMTMGDLKFKQKGREEQCEPDKPEMAVKVASLCGIDSAMMMHAFAKPKIKVGTEWVTKGQNVEQAMNAVGGIARAIFHRTFLWLIEKCNETLIDTNMKQVNFCAVLDIAGFEIFTFNGYEQLSINFVNEKLQQFFNHHMFVVEQEEYISQGIDWQMVDFGMDLAACIIMFEKPMGIWAILEEESLFPKATDKSLEEKLKATLLGKCPSFVKPQSKTDRNAHFAIVHYAGTVSYNVTNWLEKNKDPVNDTVVDVLKEGTNKLLIHIWRDHPGQTTLPTEDKGKKKKGGGSKTVSSVFLVDLNALMTTLQSTEPHFVRCIVPNTCKQPGGVDPPLIMHQLTCNGVLEGIRICMRGFPNRIAYNDFKKRYGILARGIVEDTTEDLEAAKKVLEKEPSFPTEKYRIGLTKVFFRAGALAQLEEFRDDVVNDLILKIQGATLGYMSRLRYIIKARQRTMVTVLQRTFRKYSTFKNWKWFQLIKYTTPLIGEVKMEEVLEILEERTTAVTAILTENEERAFMFREQNVKLEEEIAALKGKMGSEYQIIENLQDRTESTKKDIDELKIIFKDLNCKLTEEEQLKEEIDEENSSLASKNAGLAARKQSYLERKNELNLVHSKKEREVKSLNKDIAELDQSLSKLGSDKKIALDQIEKQLERKVNVYEQLSTATETVNKLEELFDSIQNETEQEKFAKEHEEEVRIPMEAEIKEEQSKLHVYSKEKVELEQAIKQLETTIQSAHKKLSYEELNACQTQRLVKELEKKAESMEDELQVERQSKLNAEYNRSDLARTFEQMTTNLEEAEANSLAQMQINNKLDSRMEEMRRDKEELQISWEATLLKLKKRHQEAQEEMMSQMDTLKSLRVKAERDMYAMKMDLQETLAATDRIKQDISMGENTLKQLKEKLGLLDKKINEHQENLQQTEKFNKKMLDKNSSLSIELDNLKISVTASKGETKTLEDELQKVQILCEAEERERISLLGKTKTAQHEYDGIRVHWLEEQASKRESLFKLERALTDLDAWQKKYKKDIQDRVEDLELSKTKLQARLVEAENMMSTVSKKYQNAENKKLEMIRKVEEYMLNNERENYRLAQAEKQVREMDMEVVHWKTRADSIGEDLANSQNNCRSAAAELFKYKGLYEESTSSLENARAGNKQLSNDIKDSLDKINEGGRKIHEIETLRKQLENEKSALNDALEEIEMALVAEESKLKTVNIEIDHTKKTIEQRIENMNKDFEVTKSNNEKAIKLLQGKTDELSKEKAEINFERHQQEEKCRGFEDDLRIMNTKHCEHMRKLQQLQKDIEMRKGLFHNEEKRREEAADDLLTQERRLRCFENEVEESKSLLDQSDRARRQMEQELLETQEHLRDIADQGDKLIQTNRCLATAITNLKMEKDETTDEEAMAEERAQVEMLEAARLAEGLRLEQDRAGELEQCAMDLERRLRELQIKVDEEETEALRWGERMVNKLRDRVKVLEVDTEMEKRRLATAGKNMRKAAREGTELEFRIEEGRKSEEKMKCFLDKLQNQISHYKKQIGDAEEIAAINLSKWHRVVKELETAGEREESLRSVLALLRNRRSASLGL